MNMNQKTLIYHLPKIYRYDQQICNIYKREVDAFSHSNTSLKNRLDLSSLKNFYSYMQFYYEAYRFHDQDKNRGFINSMQSQMTNHSISLEAFLRYAHLSPYVLIDDCYYSNLFNIFTTYVNFIRPEVRKIVASLLLSPEQEEEETLIPF